MVPFEDVDGISSIRIKRLTVWDVMISLLDSCGFQSYPIADSDDSDAEVSAEVSKPLTIIQLVRGSIGVAPSHAGRSTDCFWGAHEMAKTLKKIWAVLEDALRKIDSGQMSIVAWCFSPPERELSEIRKVIQIASELAPDFECINFLCAHYHLISPVLELPRPP